MSNAGATFFCLGRREEAERAWLKVIKAKPSYLEAVEHLVGLLYKKRGREAVDIISFVQNSLRITLGATSSTTPSGPANALVRSLPNTGREDAGSALHIDAHGGPQAAYGSSGYALPSTENGRIMALIHAKGTMLYSLKDLDRASRAFEEAVLIAIGSRLRTVPALIRRIQTVLAPSDDLGPQSRPLLLPPDRAKHTARLVFASDSVLPGLEHIASGAPRRAALQTTSNSLLSLAKIFQDAMAAGNPGPSLLGHRASIHDILPLYYLSLSLQESPSTANNVGILLAGVQQAAPADPGLPHACVAGSARSLEAQPPSNVPGIVPGTGLALALAYYNYGLTLDPKHVHLHTNLGSLLKDVGQLDRAIQMYEQAVLCDGSFDIALTNLANAVKDRGRVSDAIMYYKRAVASNPDFAEAVCGLFTALNSVCDWRGRGGVYSHGGHFDRWHVDDDGMLVDAVTRGHGGGLAQRVVDTVDRQLQEAAAWGQGALTPQVAQSLISQLDNAGVGVAGRELGGTGALVEGMAGGPWEGSRLVRIVERTTRALMRRWYLDRHVLGNEASHGFPRPQLPSSLTVPAAPTVLPFHTFTCPLTASQIRLISQRNALRISCSTLRAAWLSSTIYPPPAPPEPVLNVGYVSSDFNNHPLAHL